LEEEFFYINNEEEIKNILKDSLKNDYNFLPKDKTFDLV